ncbi:Anaphase-promoting complex subunit 4 [Schistosoma japonicum]|nr:Anaphase-promoting complex subunit 4 [Schistosoma japonicum]
MSENMVVDFTYSLVETRQLVKTKLVACVWSPKTDLIALGSASGCVSVHRYKMTCIWECDKSDLGSVSYLAWRPDGKILTAAFSSGTICFFVVGDGFIFHELQFSHPIDYLLWTNYQCSSSTTTTTTTTTNSSEETKCPAFNVSTYFPDVKHLTMFKSDVNFSSSDVCKYVQLLGDTNNNSFPILTVYSKHVVYFYGYGVFEIAAYDFRPPTSTLNHMDTSKLISCHLSAEQNILLVTESFNNIAGQFYVVCHKIPCNGFQKFRHQLMKLSSQAYSIKITKSVCTCWEDMILEMDAKFTKYARERLKQNKKFLVEDWTAASLKRTGTATLKAYESIKTICFQQIQFFLQRLLFHVSEVLGSLRDTQLCHELRIPATTALTLFRTIGMTLQKTQELQLVIEKSLTQLRAFFKWLYGAILEQSGRLLPNDFPRVNLTERELVINFITDSLQPVFVQGELQNYQVDLVEQYIRSGEVYKPLEVVAQSTLKNDKDRAYLRKALEEIIDQVDGKLLPDGLYHYCSRTTLADLIQKKMDCEIKNLIKLQSTNNTTRGCLDPNCLSTQILFSGDLSDFLSFGVHLSTINCFEESAEMKSSQMISRDDSTNTNTNNKPETILMAYTIGDESFGFNSLLTIELDCNNDNMLQYNLMYFLSICIFILMLLSHKEINMLKLLPFITFYTLIIHVHYFRIMNGVELLLDMIPGDSNPAHLSYELQDMQFYSSQILLLIVSRHSKHSRPSYIRTRKISTAFDENSLTREPSATASSTSHDLMHSWLVMVPIRDVMNSIENDNREVSKQTNAIASIVNESIQTNLPRRNISEFITHGNVEALPWHAIKLTTNGDRSIVFVLFENHSTCRVYLMERPEPDETMVVDYSTNDNHPQVPADSCDVVDKVILG